MPLVETIAQVIIPYLDKPFAFYGHCMGSLIGFEVAHLLRKEYNCSPIRLLVACLYAPQTVASSLKYLSLSEEKISDFVEIPRGVQEDKQFMQHLLSIGNLDYQLLHSYIYSHKEPLDCPISAWYGLLDPIVSQESISEWREHTSSTFNLHMIPDRHIFLTTHRKMLLETISQELIATIN